MTKKVSSSLESCLGRNILYPYLQSSRSAASRGRQDRTRRMPPNAEQGLRFQPPACVPLSTWAARRLPVDVHVPDANLDGLKELLEVEDNDREAPEDLSGLRVGRRVDRPEVSACGRSHGAVVAEDGGFRDGDEDRVSNLRPRESRLVEGGQRGTEEVLRRGSSKGVLVDLQHCGGLTRTIGRPSVPLTGRGPWKVNLRDSMVRLTVLLANSSG